MTLVLLDEPTQAHVMPRETPGARTRENPPRDLVFAHPELLPVHELEPGLGRIIPVATELTISGTSRLDALFMSEHGRLIVVECKLWRNPQARREVVGQILDYARQLSRFSYESLQAILAGRLRRRGNVLYDLAREAGGALPEASSVDQVSRDLAAGRFLLLVVGDGITEGTQRIGEYLQGEPGLAFTFGMVEMAEYRFADPLLGRERTIMHPRLLARTTVIERGVIRSEVPGLVIDAPVADAGPPREPAGFSGDSDVQAEWRAFATRLLGALRFDDPGQPPASIGGMNWLRVPIPGPSHLTLWRSRPKQVAGVFVRYKGAEGLATFDLLESDRTAIDAEFDIAGLPGLRWTRREDEALIELDWPACVPGDDRQQAEQIERMSHAANRFVTSLRHRLLDLHQLAA